MKNLSQRLNDIQPLFGLFSKTVDPFLIEIIGKAGLDFVILDCEHGPNTARDLCPLVLAAKANGLLPIVRVSHLNASEIQRALDLGIAGIQVPQIQSGKDATDVMDAAKFHPMGQRGVCRFVRANDFSLGETSAYFLSQNENVAVIVQVEGEKGIQHLDEILEVPGLDVIFIGPYDLSQSLGLPGQVGHPLVLETISDLVSKCRERKKQVGIFVDDTEAAARYARLGVKYIAYSVDVGIFAGACKSIARTLKEKVCFESVKPSDEKLH